MYEVIVQKNEIIKEVEGKFETLTEAKTFCKRLILLQKCKKEDLEIQGPEGIYKIKGDD